MDLLLRSGGAAPPGQPPETRRSAGSWQPPDDGRTGVAASLLPTETGELDVRREAGSAVDDPASMAREKVVPVEKAAPAPAASPPGSTAARERHTRRRPLLFLFVLILAIEIPSTPLHDPESSPDGIAESGDALIARGAPIPPAAPRVTLSLAPTGDPTTRRSGAGPRPAGNEAPTPTSAGSAPASGGRAEPAPDNEARTPTSADSAPASDGQEEPAPDDEERAPASADSAPASGGRAAPAPGVAGLAGTVRLAGGAPALDLSTERRATERPGRTSGSDAGPRQAASLQGAVRVREQPQLAACPAEAAKDPVVLVFDGSVSMGLPLNMPRAIEVDLDRRMAAGDQSARLEYRRWLATDQPKRIEVAKQAVGEMLGIADPALSIAAVAFTGCREIATHPYVGFEGRSRLDAFVGSVTPRRGGDTALVRSLESALDMIRGGGAGGRGRVIMLTDGQETCGGDVCALAAAAAKSQPGVRVDVIDLSGLSNTRCLAEATGGVIVNYAEVRGRLALGPLLAQAANQCPAR